MSRAWPRPRPADPVAAYFILADYGKIGQCFIETDPITDFETMIGLINDPPKVIAVYFADEDAGTFRNVTGDVADHFAKLPWDEIGGTAQELLREHGLAPDETERAA